MKRAFIGMILMLLFNSMVAQNITLSGRVIDSQSVEPLPFANAALYNPTDSLFVRGITTDLEGHFSIKEVKAGTYLMKITMVGYQSWEQEVTVEKNLDLGAIKLIQGTMLSVVQISASRPIFTVDGEKNIYCTSNDPSIQSGSVVDALQNAPGIEVDAEGNIRLRGNQEVSIWINGRESRMNPEALKQYLKTLPANRLKRIEVITNPSARYGGGCPVVNIVTNGKRDDDKLLSLGINGSSKPEASPWISYIYNNEKWETDLYANFAYLHEVMTQTGQEKLLNLYGDTSRTDHYTQKKEEKNMNALLSADLAYRPDSLTTIYAWGSLTPSWTSWKSATSMQRKEWIHLPGDYSFEEQMRKSMGTKPSGGFMDGIWIERTLGENPSHTLMGGYYGSLWKRDSLVEGVRTYTVANPMQFRQKNEGKEWFHCIEANYIRPIGQMDSLKGTSAYELELGGEVSLAKSIALVATDTTTIGGLSNCKWMNSSTDESTTSTELYASLLRRWKRVTIKGGLRCKTQTGKILYLDDPTYDFSHKNTNFTPSFHLTYTTAKQGTFSLGYTYRTGVPNTGDFSRRKKYTLDDYSIGNPLLKNSATHNLEMKWDLDREGLGSIGANCYFSALSNQKETMTDVVMDNDIFHQIVIFRQPVNIGSSWNSGIDLHIVYRPCSFVNVRLNGNLRYDWIGLEFRNEYYRNGMFCYSLRLNTWVKIWNKVQFFGNAYYNSPTQRLFNITRARKGIDLGVNAELFDRRLSLNVGVNDLFNWNNWSTTSTNSYLMSDTELKLNSRYVSFSATYRIGTMNLNRLERRIRQQKTE